MKDLKIEIRCPNCNKKIKEKVKNIRPGNSRSCPSCATIIEFTGDDGRIIQHEFDKFEKKLKKTFSKITFK